MRQSAARPRRTTTPMAPEANPRDASWAGAPRRAASGQAAPVRVRAAARFPRATGRPQPRGGERLDQQPALAALVSKRLDLGRECEKRPERHTLALVRRVPHRRNQPPREPRIQRLAAHAETFRRICLRRGLVLEGLLELLLGTSDVLGERRRVAAPRCAQRQVGGSHRVRCRNAACHRTMVAAILKNARTCLSS